MTGGGGQLGRALQALAPKDVTVIALTHAELDIADEGVVSTLVAREAPDLILNAAAYTAVDRAESEPEAAARVNAQAPGVLARVTAARGIRLVHVSTDFVFDGMLGRPYRPGDAPNPLSVYGASKLAGEEAVAAADADALVVRTAWVHGATGANFVATMLRLMAERDRLGVVADQIGTPTHVDGLAEALWRLAASDARGIVHHTDAGVASWYDFAVAIREEGLALGLIDRAAQVTPIATADYPTPARRPGIAILDKESGWTAAGITPLHWREGLRRALIQRKSLT